MSLANSVGKGQSDQTATLALGPPPHPLFSVDTLMGPSFRTFYMRVTEALPQNRAAIVDSFLSANPSLPFIEDTVAHFIYRGPASSVNVPGDMNAWTNTAHPMYRLPGTDLWFRAGVFERDAFLLYAFVLDGRDTITRDTRNPHLLIGKKTVLSMPEYVEAPEIRSYPGIPHGTLLDTTYHSTVLVSSHTAHIYLPPGYDPLGTTRYPVALFHDGSGWITYCRAESTMNYLIHHNRIKPMIGVFVDPVNRDAEYVGWQRVQYSAFLVNDVMAYVDSRFRTLTDPASRAILGYSFGSEFSLWMAYNYSGTFGNVGAFSGAGNDGISMYGGTKQPLKLYCDVGTYEHPIAGGIDYLTRVRQFHDIVQNKGYENLYREWHAGHTWGSWRSHLDNALEFFFPGMALGIKETQQTPTTFVLLQNYPNPFNPSTTIKFELPKSAELTLSVYDMLGREVAVLLNEKREPGSYDVMFDGNRLSSGVYFYRLRAGDFLETKRFLLLR